jgi:hypothetical protein
MSREDSLGIGRSIRLWGLAMLWLAAGAGATAAASYSFSLDRFETVGNLPGHAVDEFDDGVVDWEVHDPTVTEDGGVLTFSTPGNILPFDLPACSGYSEMSYVSQGAGPFLVQNGAGDFVGTSTWIRAIPGPSQFFKMNFGYGVDGGNVTDGSLKLWNFSPWEADCLGIPSAGLYVVWGMSGETDTEYEVLAVSASDITGDVIFEMTFHDADNEITARFSLDGGSTFQTPFQPIPCTWPEEEYGDFGCGAESHTLAAASIAAVVDIDPDTINLKSKGKWITAYIGLPEPYDAGDIDLDTIVLKKDEFEVGAEYGEFESGRVKVKFPRAAVQSVLEPGEVELTVLGELEDGTPFEGTDTVRVIEPQ